MRVTREQIGPELVWFFEGQFAVAEAIADGYTLNESKFLDPGEIVIIHPFRCIAFGSAVWALIKEKAVSRATSSLSPLLP